MSSPRTGSATIRAASRPSANHPSVPVRQPPPACEAAQGGLLPLPAASDEALWNQSDVAEAAAGPVSRVAAAVYAGMTASSGDGPAAAEAAMVP